MEAENSGVDMINNISPESQKTGIGYSAIFENTFVTIDFSYPRGYAGRVNSRTNKLSVHFRYGAGNAHSCFIMPSIPDAVRYIPVDKLCRFPAVNGMDSGVFFRIEYRVKPMCNKDTCQNTLRAMFGYKIYGNR